MKDKALNVLLTILLELIPIITRMLERKLAKEEQEDPTPDNVTAYMESIDRKIIDFV